MSELLRVEEFFVYQQKRPLVQGVSFALAPGGLTGLLGANGSGKTTLLRGICGLLPTSGSCLVQGRETAGLTPRQRARHMAYIPQRPELAAPLTAVEVVCMGYNPVLGLAQSPTAQQVEGAARQLAALGLGEKAGQLFQTLSEGQKQLVLLARALVQDTPLLLLDEPDSALDFNNRHAVLGQLQKSLAQTRRAGLLTVHDANFALQYCHTLLLLAEGRLVGRLCPGEASGHEMEAQLRNIYPTARLVRHSGGWAMIREAAL